MELSQVHSRKSRVASGQALTAVRSGMEHVSRENLHPTGHRLLAAAVTRVSAIHFHRCSRGADIANTKALLLKTHAADVLFYRLMHYIQYFVNPRRFYVIRLST